jgi:2-polyprenyl-6-methoxyphenol hydroxylase-like FAD-dependent oxidoreductase
VRTAVVVGAGVGGLATAGALARSGWRVTLVERGDRLRGCGSAQVIWRNGAAALAALGINIAAIAIPLPDNGIRRPDGRVLVPPGGLSGAAGVDTVIVNADDLHEALMAALGDRVEIHTGTEITSVRAGTAARPSVAAGDRRFEADLVVAADGSRSFIRSRLLPASTVAAAGYTSWRAVIPWFRVPRLAEGQPFAGDLLGTGHRFRYASLGERGSLGGPVKGGVYWAATVPGAPRPESAPTQLALLRRWFAGWISPVTDLLAVTEPDDLAQQAGEELRPTPARFDVPVGAGGFVVLGDAAHVSTPNLAQGACLAFEDAATLASLVRDALPGQTLPMALGEYTQARRARAAHMSRLSRRLGTLLQAEGGLSVRARDAVLTRLAPRWIDRALASTVDWEPPR